MKIKSEIVVVVWLAIIFLLLYLYFFQPHIFNHIFKYPGPGSPFINTPQG